MHAKLTKADCFKNKEVAAINQPAQAFKNKNGQRKQHLRFFWWNDTFQ